MGNENVTLTAQRGDANLLKDAHLGSLVFKEYNPKFEKYPLVARVIKRAAMAVVPQQQFKWSVQNPEARYFAPVPNTGSSGVGLYTAVDHADATFSHAGSTQVTGSTMLAAGSTLYLRLTSAEAMRIHPRQVYEISVNNLQMRDGVATSSRLPGHGLIDVVSLFSADTGYVVAICKVLEDRDDNGTVGATSYICRAVAANATASVNLIGTSMPEGSGMPGGHMIDPVEFENYTQIVMRAFGATRSRAGRVEKFNGPNFNERLQNQALDTFLAELEGIAWFGKHGIQTSQDGIMLQRDYGTVIQGNRWFTDGVRGFLQRNAAFNDNVKFVPKISTIGGRSVAGKSWFEGFLDFYKGLITEATLFNPKATLRVYCGNAAYSDTMDALEAMYSRQIGESTTDTHGFRIHKIMWDGVTLEFQRNLSWVQNPAYSRMIAIVDADDIDTKIFKDGKFRLIEQREDMPKTVDMGDNWKDGYTKSYFWDGGFVFNAPESMFMVDGVGLDFAS